MKTLLLMRHAKSSWKDQKLADIERPLSKRGQLNPPLVGVLLREKELVPQLILSSTAVRARMTAELVAAGAEYTGDIQYLRSLYLAEPSVYLGALSTIPDDFERVMVVGHNPGLEGLLQILTRRIMALSANSVAFISLPIQSWSELNLDVEGELIELLTLSEAEDEKAQEQDKKIKKSIKIEKKDDKKTTRKESEKNEKKEYEKGKKKGK